MAGPFPIMKPSVNINQPVGNKKLLLLIVINTLIIVSGYFIYREGLRRAQTPSYFNVPSQVQPYKP